MSNRIIQIYPANGSQAPQQNKPQQFHIDGKSLKDTLDATFLNLEQSLNVPQDALFKACAHIFVQMAYERGYNLFAFHSEMTNVLSETTSTAIQNLQNMIQKQNPPPSNHTSGE